MSEVRTLPRRGLKAENPAITVVTSVEELKQALEDTSTSHIELRDHIWFVNDWSNSEDENTLEIFSNVLSIRGNCEKPFPTKGDLSLDDSHPDLLQKAPGECLLFFHRESKKTSILIGPSPNPLWLDGLYIRSHVDHPEGIGIDFRRWMYMTDSVLQGSGHEGPTALYGSRSLTSNSGKEWKLFMKGSTVANWAAPWHTVYLAHDKNNKVAEPKAWIKDSNFTSNWASSAKYNMGIITASNGTQVALETVSMDPKTNTVGQGNKMLFADQPVTTPFFTNSPMLYEFVSAGNISVTEAPRLAAAPDVFLSDSDSWLTNIAHEWERGARQKPDGTPATDLAVYEAGQDRQLSILDGPSASQSQSKTSTPIGAVVGGAVAAAVLLLVATLAVMWLRGRHRTTRLEEAQEEAKVEEEEPESAALTKPAVVPVVNPSFEPSSTDGKEVDGGSDNFLPGPPQNTSAEGGVVHVVPPQLLDSFGMSTMGAVGLDTSATEHNTHGSGAGLHLGTA